MEEQTCSRGHTHPWRKYNIHPLEALVVWFGGVWQVDNSPENTWRTGSQSASSGVDSGGSPRAAGRCSFRDARWWGMGRFEHEDMNVLFRV